MLGTWTLKESNIGSHVVGIALWASQGCFCNAAQVHSHIKTGQVEALLLG